MKKVKVINDYDITITLNFESLDGRVVKILPKNFGYITEDQLLYLTYSSKIIQSGLIRVDKTDVETEKPDIEKSVNESNIFTEERIKELLSLSVEGIKKELEDIDNSVGLEELLERAEKEDKAKGFIEAVKKRIDELM